MGAKISAPLLLSFVLIAPVTISRCCSKTEAKVIGHAHVCADKNAYMEGRTTHVPQPYIDIEPLRYVMDLSMLGRLTRKTRV